MNGINAWTATAIPIAAILKVSKFVIQKMHTIRRGTIPPCYIGAMGAQSNIPAKRRPRAARALKRPLGLPEPIIASRRSRMGRIRSLSIQWYDGAGEMHLHTLGPSESLAFLQEEK